MVLFKHLLRYVKLIEDSKTNNFGLTFWEKYRISSGYLNFHPEIKNYEKKYEKEYLDYLKNAEIIIVRAVNRKFPELSYTSTFSQNFYQQYKVYLISVLRMVNHEVMKKAKSYASPRYYQALESLYLYYNFVEEKSNGENCPSICFKGKIMTEYSKSKISHEEHEKLR